MWNANPRAHTKRHSIFVFCFLFFSCVLFIGQVNPSHDTISFSINYYYFILLRLVGALPALQPLKSIVLSAREREKFYGHHLLMENIKQRYFGLIYDFIAQTQCILYNISSELAGKQTHHNFCMKVGLSRDTHTHTHTQTDAGEVGAWSVNELMSEWICKYKCNNKCNF